MKLSERKAEVLRAKTVDELKDELVQLKKEQFNLRFQEANQQVQDVSRAKWVRRKIATVKTLLREQEIGLNTAAKTKQPAKKAAPKAEKKAPAEKSEPAATKTDKTAKE